MSGKPDAPTSPTLPNPKQPTKPHLQIQPLTLLQKKSCEAQNYPGLSNGKRFRWPSKWEFLDPSRGYTCGYTCGYTLSLFNPEATGQLTGDIILD
jgi:hypothetical protein